MSETTKIEIKPKAPRESGTFIFKGIQEEEGADVKRIRVDPPLVIKYEIFDKLSVDGEENFKENVKILGYATFDFGMVSTTALNPENNYLVGGYQGLTKDSTLEEIMMKSLMFDLFHSLCHDTDDPNYSFYHWALFGNLKNRAQIEIL